MRITNRVHAILLGVFAAASASSQTAPTAQALNPPTAGSWGVELRDQDRSTRPGDGFYRYQNGAWLDRVTFAPNQKADAHWRDVRLLAIRRLSALFDRLAKANAPLSNRQAKAVAFYRSFMDDKTVEQKGLAPLEPDLKAIRSVASKSDLARVMGAIAGPGTLRLQRMYGPTPGWTFFRIDDIGQDLADPGRYAVYLGAGGLVLPGPEYYSEAQFAELRNAYVEYITRVLTLLHWPSAADHAHEIVELETRLAKVSWSHVQMLDQAATYNRITIDDLRKLAPGFDWRAFLHGARLDDVRSVVIDAKSAFPAIAAIFAQAPLELLQARQAFGIADQRVNYLDSTLLKAAIAFRGEALGNGTFMGAAPRDVLAEKEAEGVIPDIVSALYVAEYSSAEVKAQVQDMAERMRKAMEQRLRNVSWMEPPTRTHAAAELASMRILIGFPDRFDDYDGLEIRDDDLFGNLVRSAAYQWQLLRERLDKPFDRSAWSVRAEYPTFNYSPSSNTVEVPAALLVPPFFDLRADPAVNYGSVGSTIGALIAGPFYTKQGLSHGADGRLQPWLGPAERARLDSIWQRLAAQYSTVEPLPGFHLKGELLADEALGDLAGLAIALDAYHASLAGMADRVIDGYSGDQRFFLGRAQMWRAKFAESFVRSQIATGSNEPPFMRVDGLLPNMDAWYAAFDVVAGNKLFLAPEQRVRLW